MKRSAVVAGLVLFVCAAPAWTETATPAGSGVNFAPVMGVPVPLQSISGRFSSLNPPNRRDCPFSTASGRVVSAGLMMANEAACGQKEAGNVLINVRLANPDGAGQMVVGARIVIRARFTSGEERRAGPFSAFFLIAENAELVPGGAPDGSPPHGPAFTSYMLCQPPELDGLAAKLGSDLCVQDTLMANLGVTGPALEVAARASADAPPVQTASSDPEAISCRPDREHSALHLRGIACARNSYWAWYNEKWRDRAFLTPPPP